MKKPKNAIKESISNPSNKKIVTEKVPDEEHDIPVTINNKVVYANPKDIDNLDGETTKPRESGFHHAVEEPAEGEILKADAPIPEELRSANANAIRTCISHDKPFFVRGHSGWGKSTLIKKVAKSMGYKIITIYTVYLEYTDKRRPPISDEWKSCTYVDMVLQHWAQDLQEHPKDHFLLFFDEMNQVSDEVMNALVPIVSNKTICGIKFDNFVVGAAGNYANEIKISEFTPALASLFEPIIVWEDETPEAWHDAYIYLHKKWDPILGKDFVDFVEKNTMLFSDPRSVERFVLRATQKDREAVNRRPNTQIYYTPKIEFGLLKPLAVSPTTSDLKILQELATKMSEYALQDINKKDNVEEEAPKRKSRADTMLDALSLKNMVENATQGFYWYVPDGVDGETESTRGTYALTEENLYETYEITLEQIEYLKRYLKEHNLKFKYKTNAEAAAAGINFPKVVKS